MSDTVGAQRPKSHLKSNAGAEGAAALAVCILAGGASERMGRDKAKIMVEGQALLDRAIDAALEVVDRVYVVGRMGERPQVEWLLDEVPGLGPMGGLRTALKALNQPVLLTGCDMPLLDSAALEWLATIYSKSSDYSANSNRRARHGLVVRKEGRVEPLFSIYRPAFLPLIERALRDGTRSLYRLIATGKFEQIDLPETMMTRLINLNTPEDLADFRARRDPGESG